MADMILDVVIYTLYLEALLKKNLWTESIYLYIPFKSAVLRNVKRYWRSNLNAEYEYFCSVAHQIPYIVCIWHTLKHIADAFFFRVLTCAQHPRRQYATSNTNVAKEYIYDGHQEMCHEKRPCIIRLHKMTARLSISTLFAWCKTNCAVRRK